jgi:hypothetical protein
MLKLFALAGLAALVTACAIPAAAPGSDLMQQSRGSTPAGVSKAAALGFHGPIDSSLPVDGPN